MLTIHDFQKQSAQEYGKDSLDAIDSEYSVYLVPEQPIEELPELRVRIWPQLSVGSDHPNWTWNWRTDRPGPEVASPQDGPEIRLHLVDGKTGYATSYGSIAEAVEAAISSINDYLRNELPAMRRLEEQRALAEQERDYRLQSQVNEFLD